ncbi:MAG: SDR family oxidoreductase [Pseudomonadota bacterium]
MNVPAHHDVAIVTGAGGSLGRIICRHLQGSGLRVAMADIDVAPLEALVSRSSGVSAHALDVRNAADFARVIEQVADTWGGVGVLVNNAAVMRATPLFDITAEEFDDVVAVTLKGTFLGCQVAGRHMAGHGYGRIVNIASLAGQNGGAATGAHYAAAKGGILTLTKVFARDLAASGVTVNAISPGPLDLPSVRDLLPEEKLAAVTASIPIRSLGDPDYIARVVEMLALPSAASATGATFDINGGLYLR